MRQCDPRRVLLIVAITATLCLFAFSNFAEAGEPCEPHWAPTFGHSALIDGVVDSLAVYDDGDSDGPALYAGGFFDEASNTLVNYVARWDVSSLRWTALDEGVNHGVFDMAVYDDGQGDGPALYVCGLFTQAGDIETKYIAKWDGQSWSAVGGGFSDNARPVTMIVFKDPITKETSLYVVGEFSYAGGVYVNGFARWNGKVWSKVGDGGTRYSTALAVHDDGLGGGPALYLATYSSVHKWDGNAWSTIASGSVSASFYSLCSFDDGSGNPLLVLGGRFNSVEGTPASNIAAWNGIEWSALGEGMESNVRSVFAFDDAQRGPTLYAGEGEFVGAALHRWNGINWDRVTYDRHGRVFAMTAFSETPGAPPELYVGGEREPLDTSTPGFVSKLIAEVDGLAPLSAGLDRGVNALSLYDDGRGGGPLLAVGGAFQGVNGVPLNAIGFWDGAQWSALQKGVNGYVNTLIAHDDGESGPELYVGGAFYMPDIADAVNIARWNGQWLVLGQGLGDFGALDSVDDLIVYDDGLGEGPALYAGGYFSHAGDVECKNIARWNGTNWSPLGEGTSSRVFALAVFDDQQGQGPCLYAAGGFSRAGGEIVNRIARWNGKQWSGVGGGVTGSTAAVYALAVFDDYLGGGPALYAGGYFGTVGGIPANHLAKWNGTNWSSVGGGIPGVVVVVNTLHVARPSKNSLPVLCVGGGFTVAGNTPANSIATWDGVRWRPLGAGFPPYNGLVDDIILFDADSPFGPALYAAGGFETSPSGDSHLARWQFCTIEIGIGDIDGNGRVDVSDLLRLLALWGECASPCEPNGSCLGDLTNPAGTGPDCKVNIYDLFLLLANWTP